MRKILYSLYICFLLICSIGIVNAASISITSNKSVVNVNENVNVTVTISPGSDKDEKKNAEAWEYVLDYDSSLLTFQGENTHVIGGTLAGNKSVTFTFKAKKAGTATISLKNLLVQNYEGNNLDVKSGSISLSLVTGYKITYELNGGKNNSSNLAIYNSTQTIKLYNPTKTGYDFGGWYSDSKLTKKVTSIAKGSTGNKTFYAKWVAHKYNIKFNGNGSTSGRMSTLSNRVYGKSYTLTSNAFKKKGYTFNGWNTKANGTGISYKNKQSVKNLTSKNGATVILYAQWKKNKYTITYNLNGGKNNSSNPSYYYITTATIILKNPTKTGYTFGGWYSDSKLTKKVTTIKKGSTGNRTLYVKWIKN